VRARKAGLGVFGGGTTLPTGAVIRSRLDGIEEEQRKLGDEKPHGRLAGWNFTVPLSTGDGVVQRSAYAQKDTSGFEELRAMAALDPHLITNDELGEVAKRIDVDPAVLVGVTRALAEATPEQRAEAIHRARDLLASDGDRLKAENIAARAFKALPLNDGYEVTVFVFTYEPGPVAFKTSLTRGRLAATLGALIESWKTGAPRVVYRDRAARLPDAEATNRIAMLVQPFLEPGMGSAVLLGEGVEVNYAGTCHRDDMLPIFERFRQDAFAGDAEDLALMAAGAKQGLKDWHCPAGVPRTASHRELYAMNTAHLLGLLRWMPTGRGGFEWEENTRSLARQNPELDRLLHRVRWLFFGDMPEPEALNRERLIAWLILWRAQAYARLEVSHKLAAALCLTDVPDETGVRAPWEAWSLVVPDGLLPVASEGDGEAWPTGTNVSRVWICGLEPLALIGGDGRMWLVESGKLDDPRQSALHNLIRGACLVLMNPDTPAKRERPRGSSSSAKGRHGPPDLNQARFMLAAPVAIDLREHLTDVVLGRKGASPTVQFLVRGHPRNQAYGPGHTLRRPIWVEPFWKGPEGARVLLRQHKVEE